VPKLLRITTVPISLHLLLAGQFKFMRENGYDVFAMSADGKEVDEVVKEGVMHIAIPFTRKITPWQDLRCLFQLLRFIRNERPDIIHTHTPKAGLIGMLAARICNVPIRMHTVAGLPLMEASGLKRRILEFTEAITYACATNVYPNSAGLKRFIEKQFGIGAPKLKVIGKGSSNGIDTDYFKSTEALYTDSLSIRKQYHFTGDDIVFCFIGRVVRDKGIVELVHAFQSLRQARSVSEGDNEIKGVEGKKAGTKLLIVGHFEEDLDPLPAEVMLFLKEDPDVVLAGFQRDIRPWLLASDAFVFPSYREGFPNVVMQASLLQVPSIVSDINGCNEIITANETGLIVPPKNTEALAGAMKQLASDDGMRRNFGILARAYVAGNFDRKVIWEGLLEEYRRVSPVPPHGQPIAT
jgi:glycosyltransferase involved in cell wall biosynthesis